MSDCSLIAPRGRGSRSRAVTVGVDLAHRVHNMRGQGTRRVKIRRDSEHATVNMLELLFDLVFVFALTQVTAFMADNLTWQGLLRGVLIIGLLWWAWTGYAWLANVASADEPEIKLGLLVAMSAMFVLALTIPEAFDDGAGGLSGPIVLAVCYLLVRLCHFGIFMIVAHPGRPVEGRGPRGPGRRRGAVPSRPRGVQVAHRAHGLHDPAGSGRSPAGGPAPAAEGPGHGAAGRAGSW